MSFQAEVTRELAAQFQALAEQRKAETPLVLGTLVDGNFARARRGLYFRIRRTRSSRGSVRSRQGIVSLATRFGHDILVSGLSWRALSSWALGRATQQWLKVLEHALEKEAREFGHAATADVCTCSRVAYAHPARQLAAAAALADELVQLAEEKGSIFWKAYGMLLRGRGLSLEGDDSAAADLIKAKAFRR